MSNQFRTLSGTPRQAQNTFGRGFGQQQQLPSQGGYYQEQPQDDANAPVAWMNLYIVTETGENKRLGSKGIPLRESNALERALLDLFFDEAGNPLDVDMEALKQALVIDVRAAGQPDQEVRIALGGLGKQTEAPKQRRAVAPKAEPAPVDQDAIEALEPEQPAKRTRNLRNKA